jgi:hypothetical protein
LLKKFVKFHWTKECQNNFELILEALTNPPLLVFPDFTKEFILSTDASDVGLGAILSQKDTEGNERVIAYASRGLLPSERNYVTYEKECLAIYWGIDHFKPYLYGHKFTVQTDHNPLVYLNSYKSKRMQKWRVELEEYNKNIVYKKGILNANADALSRVEEIGVNLIQNTPIEETDIRDLQMEDTFISKQIQFMNERNCSRFNNFALKENILYCSKHVHGEIIYRLVIPNTLIDTILTLNHDDMGGGHLGMKKTWPKIRDSFWWPTMYQDTKNWIESCKKCAKRKSPPPRKAPLHPIQSAKMPFEMVGVDILGPLPITPAGNRYIVVFTDYLTKWP